MPELYPRPLPPSPDWDRAMPPGPLASMKIPPAYAAQVARDAYFWAWPLVNVYNRRLASAPLTETALAGSAPMAPLNRLGMLTDYVDPLERVVACPNQELVYGAAMLAPEQSPAVIQAPDFGERFWAYQIVDLRTDGFVSLGTMYGATPGFYLLVGPNWDGETPAGITRVFRCHLRRRHRNQQPQLLLPGLDGLPHAEHRPHCRRRNALHRLLRRAELHGWEVVVHHWADNIPERRPGHSRAGRIRAASSRPECR